MKRLLKKLSFVVLLLAIVFVPALLISASGAISVKVSTYTSETNPTITNVSRDLGFRQSITTPGGTTFAYFALNGYVSEKLASDFQFPVRTKTEIDAYYHPAGQFVVIFADSNNKVLDVKYVTSGQTVSVTAANTAAATLVKYGMTLNGESTRWKTSDNVGPEVAITSNRIFYAQYTVTNVNTFALTVNGGTSDKATYAFNEVATLTANADNGSGVPFSHWEDVDGNVLSTKSVYKFTMHKITTVNAVFAASPEYAVPVVNMSDAIVLRADTVSYMGQFDLPNGYTFVESGFLFSRSSMVLEKTSLGVTVAQSNVHNSTTKEYLMTFSDELFNSIRAYVTVQRTSDSAILSYYSENMVGAPVESEQIIYQTGFESSEGFTTGTTYNNIVAKVDGPVGNQWNFVYGTPSTTSPIIGSMSGQMRVYAGDENRGSISMNFSLNNVTKVLFNASTSNNINVTVAHSTNNGDTFSEGVLYTLTTTSTQYEYVLPSTSSNVRVKFTLTTDPVGTTSRVYLDNVRVYGMSSSNQHEIVYNNEGVITSETLIEGSLVSNTPSKTGYTFNGWYLDSEFETAFDNSPVDQSFILYAKYTVNNYTITLNTNGGTAIDPITQAYGTEVTQPSNPTKTGYTFDGWFSNSGLTTPYTFSTMPDSNSTIYAKWLAINYTITFNSNGGSAVSDMVAAYASVISAPTAPTKDGFEFQGWFSDAELTQSFTFSTMPLNGASLYAKWGTEAVTQPTTYTQDFSFVSSATSNYSTTLTQTDANGFDWELYGRAEVGAFGLGNNADNNYIRVTATGGISSFSVSLVRLFTNTNARTVDLYVNNTFVVRFTVNASSDTPQTFTFEDINIEGEVIIELRGTSSGSRGATKVDNFSWTDYPN